MSENQKQLDLDSVKPMQSSGLDINLDEFHGKQVNIEGVEVMQVPSKFTPLIEGTDQHQKQWALKVYSEVVTSAGEGEERIDFRASELFNLIQDKQGNLVGFPTNENSNLMQFAKDLRIKEPDKKSSLKELISEIKEKQASIKAYEKNGRTYLKFKY